MLDAFYVFTRGGLILWSFQWTALTGVPVDSLIRSCLLEERAGERSWSYVTEGAAYTLKWTFHNELRLVLVAVSRPLPSPPFLSRRRPSLDRRPAAAAAVAAGRRRRQL